MLLQLVAVWYLVWPKVSRCNDWSCLLLLCKEKGNLMQQTHHILSFFSFLPKKSLLLLSRKGWAKYHATHILAFIYRYATQHWKYHQLWAIRRALMSMANDLRFFPPSNHISWCSIAFFKLCSTMWSTEWVIVAHWLCSDNQRWDDYQTANISPDNNGSWGAHFSICLSEIEKKSEAVAI